ncbi:glycosyltransferase [Sphingomonas changnyeongensis]
MGTSDVLLWTLERATHELALFAAIGILVGGIDDLAIDLIWLARAGWRRFAVYTRFPPADAATLTASRPGRIAVFVPAWQESPVIAPMLATAVRRWDGADFRIYVGCYANDPATTAAVAPLAAADRRIRLVVNPRPGPTTKADNLNALWAALLADEQADGIAAKAVVLHDAEDVVHSAEIRVFDALSERFDLVQLPVLPLIEQGRGFWARAVSSTYADEFAESHMKQLVVREAVGAAMPSAGVGCAFSRAALMRIARLHGAPFDEASVTEDYELGLRIAEAGAGGVRAPARPRGGPGGRGARAFPRRGDGGGAAKGALAGGDLAVRLAAAGLARRAGRTLDAAARPAGGAGGADRLCRLSGDDRLGAAGAGRARAAARTRRGPIVRSGRGTADVAAGDAGLVCRARLWLARRAGLHPPVGDCQHHRHRRLARRHQPLCPRGARRPGGVGQDRTSFPIGAARRMKGGPLRFLAGTVLAWVAVRLMILWPADPPPPRPAWRWAAAIRPDAPPPEPASAPARTAFMPVDPPGPVPPHIAALAPERAAEPPVAAREPAAPVPVPPQARQPEPTQQASGGAAATAQRIAPPDRQGRRRAAAISLWVLARPDSGPAAALAPGGSWRRRRRGCASRGPCTLASP